MWVFIVLTSSQIIILYLQLGKKPQMSFLRIGWVSFFLVAGMDLSTRVKNRGSFDDTDFSIYFTCSLRSEWKKMEFAKFGINNTSK